MITKKRIEEYLLKTGRGIWIVLLLLAFCWSFYFQYNVVATGNLFGKSDRLIPIYSVETEKKVVAITFNCAWEDSDIDDILDILEKNQITASFFMTGDFVERCPDAVKKIYEAGHDIGNHGENHKNMSTLTQEQCIHEIETLHNRIYELLGIEMNLFRPPSGDYDDLVVQTATELNYYTIQWSVDSVDWKNYGVDAIIDKVVNNKNLDDGAIILLHTGTKYTKDALQGVIDGLKNQGYDFVPVSELIYQDNYQIDHTGKQIKLDKDVDG